MNSNNSEYCIMKHKHMTSILKYLNYIIFISVVFDKCLFPGNVLRLIEKTGYYVEVLPVPHCETAI